VRFRVLLLDAGGTLIEPSRPVGAIYAETALRWGCRSDPVSVDRRFKDAWARRSASTPDRVPGGRPVTPVEERAWWKELVREVFDPEGPFPDFDPFFEELQEVFMDPGQWRVYPDVLPALERAGRAGIRLAIVSNWTTRLEELIRRVGLRHHFAHVTASGAVGIAKPDPRIFHLALGAVDGRAEDAVHVGDSLHDDVHGALAAGVTPVWLRRHGASQTGEPPGGIRRAANLAEAVGLVLS
jgi:putative hydrolase of the HAD superfamily